MKLRYLGTGASEGIPAVFCKCRVCEHARNEKGKNVRTRAGFMINDDMLIDFSPDTFYNAFRFGLDLSAIKYLLVTHTHSDHFNYQDLLQRSDYASVNRVSKTLSVYGNAAVCSNLSLCPEEIAKTLQLNQTLAYNTYTAGNYEVTPVESVHMQTEQSQLFVIRGGGKTYFHAMDTGGLTEEGFEYLKNSGVTFDAATVDFTFGTMKEEFFGHHNLNQLLRLIERLKSIGAVNEKTKIVACHVAHCCGKTHEELEKTLSEHGIALAYDGLEIEI